MISAHPSRAAALTAGVLALVAGVACGATAGSPSATAMPVVAVGVAIPPDAVPWAAVPFTPYLPSPLPIPTATPAPRCDLHDLAALPIESGGATGNDALFFDFTNRTSQTCLTGGYPRVVLTEPGERTLVATSGGFWDEHVPPSDLRPGATARFAIGYSYACETGPAAPLYEHVTVTLPGGGSFTKTLSGAKPVDSQIPLGVFAQCGVTVTEFNIPSAQPVYPSDPLVALIATIEAPTTVRTGTVFTYLLTLANPTSESIALDPCRGYYQRIDSMKSQYFAFQLNCSDAHPIPAGGRESFVMEMSAAGLSVGVHGVDWHLDADGSPGPEAMASFSVIP